MTKLSKAKLKALEKKVWVEFDAKLDVKTYDALLGMGKAVIAQGGKIVNDAPLVEWKEKAEKARKLLQRLKKNENRTRRN